MDKWIQCGVTSLLFPASILNSILRKKDYRKPPGRIVQTRRGAFHVIEKGRGPITVIMDAGLSGNSLHWHHVQEELSQHTHTISFDRGGYGWSDKRKGLHDGEENVQDMTAILEAVNCTSPLVAVGHSYGGLNVRLFAHEHQERVKGIVLVDAVHEERYETEDPDRIKALKKSLRFMRIAYYSAFTGLPRLLNMKVGGKLIAKEMEPYHPFTGYKPGAYEAVYKELRDSQRTARQVAACEPVSPHLPMTIIQSNNQSEEWLRYQEKLKRLTNQPAVIQTSHGHSIHMENPPLVTKAILDQLERIKANENKERSVGL
ncbi:alpha/beta fold hydrolase [Rossellomorea sp. AcN35-11]|nr:alpha/beta hydrolase [Rossellomorea aquimaris]WJV28131.1 alpha/beta fold hydrolase [Rossellomorea sp. AcN35-11]